MQDAATSSRDLFKKLGLEAVNAGGFCGEWLGHGHPLEVHSPIDGSTLGVVNTCTPDDYERISQRAHAAFLQWRMVPAPRRGEIVRQLGHKLREFKHELAALVTLEAGKIVTEGEGEVQEMIDICDFATGLSRQLYGLTMHSERPRHRMYEQWHPLGVCGIISAFNFPVAVWSWNAAIAAVCGDSTIWKAAEKTPLTAVATIKLAEQVCRANGVDPALFSLAIGSVPNVGERLLADKRVPLVSATGSCRMGRRVAEVVGMRMGRTILELGGNNAIIVTPNANLDLATRAILFGAVGTAGQRCTSTRRVIVHEMVCDALTERLVRGYKSIRIGDPRKSDTLCGPLINKAAVETMQKAIAAAREQGGTVIYGGEPLSGPEYPGGCYVRPCIIDADGDMPIVHDETFAPILYIIAYGRNPLPEIMEQAQRQPDAIQVARQIQTAVRESLAEAIAIQNAVPQGLSSSIFTNDLLEAEEFLSAIGSDCGIANVNIGTSGAEIGGAFGGEKETGGGRESGSDSWKVYMRRQTNTINWSTELPLAQGVRFGD